MNREQGRPRLNLSYRGLPLPEFYKGKAKLSNFLTSQSSAAPRGPGSGAAALSSSPVLVTWLLGPEVGSPFKHLPKPLHPQAEPVGLVGEDDAEPAGLFTLERLARGQQHLAVQKPAPQ